MHPPTLKTPRPVGRLGQLNKRSRLVRRGLGQWKAPEQVAKEEAMTRYMLAELEWRGA